MKNPLLYFILLFFITTGLTAQIAPNGDNILYVNASVTGGNGSGSSWENALTELADALKYAKLQDNYTSGNPLKIFVGQGHYVPKYSPKDGSFGTPAGRDNSFLMVKNVKIYGGFDPDNGITDLSHTRRFSIPEEPLVGTFLSGGLEPLKAYHVIVSVNDVGVTELNGVTIENGQANGSGSISVSGYNVTRIQGGGIFNRSSSFVLKNVVLSENSASNFGGGMFNDASSPILINVVLIDNTATSGGGMLNRNSTPRLTNVTISSNSVSWAGGGIHNEGVSNPIITNSIVWGNTASQAGNDIYSESTSSPVISYSLVKGINNTTNNGLDGTDPSIEPLFINPTMKDYRLLYYSPVINTGSNNIYDIEGGNLEIDTDVIGNSRLYNGTPNTDLIDLGAYEFQNDPDNQTNYFITTWRTSRQGSSSVTSIIIPAFSGELYNYDVSWNNDGIWENGFTGSAEHDYGAIGIYTVAIRGNFPRIFFNNNGDRQKIDSIEQWGNNPWSSMENSFKGCSYLRVNASDTPDLSQVTSTASMFFNASYFNQYIGDWDVSNVTNMSNMFSGAIEFNQDIGNWNVGNVTDMNSMFESAWRFNHDIGNWDVGNVTNMFEMFKYARNFDQDIGNWDVSNVSNMQAMFYDINTPAFNQNLGGWDIGNVTNMTDIFNTVTFSTENYDNTLLGWATDSSGTAGDGVDDIPSDINLNGGYSQFCYSEPQRQSLISTHNWTITDEGKDLDCISFDYFITTWKTDNEGVSNNTSITIPTILGEVYNYDVSWENDGIWETGFTGNASHDYETAGTYTVAIRGTFPRIYFNGNGDNKKILSIEQWGTIEWTSMYNAFFGCINLTGNAIDTPDLSNLTNMHAMFSYTNFNQDISDWDISNVTVLGSLFAFNPVFNQDLGSWNTENVITMAWMFHNAEAFNQDISNWNVGNVNTMEGMFKNASAFNQEIVGWDVGNVTNMSNMFDSAIAFNQDIGNWDVSNVSSMRFMFNNASSFNQDISNWDVSSVINMYSMFQQASGFNQNIGNWNVSNVAYMTDMFAGVTLSTSNYDALLSGWSSLTLQNNVIFSGGGSQYCHSMFARDSLTNTFGWTITDGGIGCEASDNFITTWKTDNLGSSSNTSVTIPVFEGESYNYEVSWENNGVWETFTAEASHDYGTAGTYTVAIRGTFPRIYFTYNSDRRKLLSMEQWGTTAWSSMRLAFYGCNNLVGNATDTPNLSELTDMTGMFREASSFNQDINDWDVSNVTQMNGLFRDAISFNQDLSDWDLSNVTDMSNMFANVTLSVENYDNTLIGWATDTSGTVGDGTDDIPMGVNFNGGNNQYCLSEIKRQSLISIHDWTITDDGIDSGCETFDYFITSWKTDNPGNSGNSSIIIPTLGADYNYDVSWENDGNWEIGFTGDAPHTYEAPGTYTVAIRGSFPRIYFNNTGDRQKILSIEQWGNNSWSTMNRAFMGCNNLVCNATDVPDLSEVTNMSYAFSDAISFNQDIGNWNVGNVADMSSMFEGASSFNQNLSEWNVINVTDMSNMFTGVTLSTENYDNTLIGWATDSSGILDDGIDDIPNGIIFNGGNSKYCLSEVERESLMTSNNWTITDGAKDPDCVTNYFITTWQTDNLGVTGSTSIRIPTYGGGYNYDVSWENDGNWELGFTGNASHNYGTAGTYTVAIRGDFPRIYFNNTGDKEKIISIEQWGNIEWSSMNRAFYGCVNLLENASDTPDLTNMTDMSVMLAGASAYNGDIGDWDVSNVTNMNALFLGASAFNHNIGDWNVSNVTNMSYMFYEASAFNHNIGDWDVSNVTNMSNMFYNATSFNQDIGSWNVSNVIDMSSMFERASSFNQYIGDWNVSNVTNMHSMFRVATSFNRDLGDWDVSNVTQMNGMFLEASTFNKDIGEWDVSNVTNMSIMFYSAHAFDQDIGNWDVSNVTNMSFMFQHAHTFNQNIGSWDVNNVTVTQSMFYQAFAFNQNLGNWDIGNVTDMTNMFSLATLSTENYDNTLTGWATDSSGVVGDGIDDIPNTITFSGGNSVYCVSETERQNLIDTYDWTVTDNGLDPLCAVSTIYTYNNGWLPSDPNGIASDDDDLVIANGDATINTNTTCNSVIINPGAGLNINTGITLTVTNGVKLESSSTSYSSLILDGSIIGIIDYERHVNINGSGETGNNDLVSAPLTGQAFDEFATANPNILNNGSLYLFGPFDKVTGEYLTWSGTETATLSAGVGYRAATSDNSVVTFTGTAENSIITNNIQNSGPTEHEWNLVGNPYPSYLSVQDFLNHEVDTNVSNLSLMDVGTAAIYGYDGSALDGWIIYNLANTTSSTKIAPGQGFFVSADVTKTGLYDLEFSPSMRRTGSGDDFIAGRNAELIYLALNISSSNSSYATDFYFNSNASEGFDVGYDAEIWGGTAPDFGIYSHLVQENLGQPMALQTLNTTNLEEISIPLGVHANQGEQITFSIADTTLPTSVNVYLEDVVANTFTLLNNSDYILTPTTALSGTGRFFLHIATDALALGEFHLNTLNIYSIQSNRSIVVEGVLQNETNAIFYDILGRKVMQEGLDTSLTKNVLSAHELSSGIYVVELHNDNQKVSQKVILK